MKNKLIIFALALFALTACDSSDDSNDPIVTKDPLKVSPERLELGEDGYAVQMTVEAAGNWTISVNTSEWLHVTPTEGSGRRSVEVKANKNTGDERSGTITVTSGSVRKSVTVVQKATTTQPEPEPNPNTPSAGDNIPPSAARRYHMHTE